MSETIKKYGLKNSCIALLSVMKKIAIFADEFKKHIKDGKEKRTRGERNLFRQKIQEEEHEAEQLGGRSNQGRQVKSSERVGREISSVEDDKLFRDAEERDRVTARGM